MTGPDDNHAITDPVPDGATTVGPRSIAMQRVAELKLNRILVPMDGTPAGEYALPFGTMIARWVDGELTLLHALIPMHPARGGRPGQVQYPDAQHDRGTSLATSYLEEIAARLAPHGVAARWSVATGATAQTITTRAATGGFGLIVVASRPINRVRRRFRARLLDTLWRLTAVPLLVLDESRSHRNGTAPRQPHSFIIPFDGTDTSLAAVPVASALAGAAGGNVILLRCPRRPDIPALRRAKFGQTTDSRSEDELERALAILEENQADVVVDAATGYRVETVAARQQAEPGSWVVTGSKMRSGVRRTLLGSIADHVVRAGSGPVVVVPSPSVAQRRSQAARADSLISPEVG